MGLIMRLIMANGIIMVIIYRNGSYIAKIGKKRKVVIPTVWSTSPTGWRQLFLVMVKVARNIILFVVRIIMCNFASHKSDNYG